MEYHETVVVEKNRVDIAITTLLYYTIRMSGVLTPELQAALVGSPHNTW